MCVAGCLEAIRRGGLRAPAAPAGARALARAVPPRDPPRRFARVVDLTHAMGPDFPCFDPGPGLVVETVATLAADGYNMRRWLLVEHTGTHLDAPVHYDDGAASADQLAIEDLVVPLVVIDIAAKAQDDPDAELTPDDPFGVRGGARTDSGAQLRRHAQRLGPVRDEREIRQRGCQRRPALSGLSP